ncbi:PAS domain-containing protein [Deferribacter autotrophicus]|uniref:PAS domain-containing protein n=1 Tax=Deferribacter autotrophicus TaxID=500465 RepID=A0A5A8F2Z7_9BACT|nr:PAS domain-containing protein [Deferribacter autotrophicus]KAA0258505.1 PAS domain-containing protein [Deferribacter autotrophicus]
MTMEEFIDLVRQYFHHVFFFYNRESDLFYKVTEDKIENIQIPEILKPYLLENFSGAKYFAKKDKQIVFLFVQVTLSNGEGVLILYDTKNLKNLASFLGVFFEKYMKLQNNAAQFEKEVEFLRDELNECETTVSKLDGQVKRLESLIDDYKLQIEGLEESVQILRKSRKKMLKLIDGMKNPLFSIDLNYELNNVNEALGRFTGVDSLPKFIGSKCFKTIFNFEQPCKWCKINEVVDSKISVSQHISVNKGDKKIWFEQTMYPIFDEEGRVIEVGEILQDITEQYELLEDLEKTQDKIKKISKDRIHALNEVNQLKSEYQKLLEGYNSLVERNQKLTNVIEKLLKESHVGQIIDLKKENNALKVKLEKLHTIIERLKSEVENLRKKERENIKKSIYSIDRLFNMITKRGDFKKEEYEKVFNFISTQLESIKNKLGIKEDGNGSESSN